MSQFDTARLPIDVLY